MGDECTCEQCRGRGDSAFGAWLIRVSEAATRGLALPRHDRWLVAGERGISIRLAAADAGANVGRTPGGVARLL